MKQIYEPLLWKNSNRFCKKMAPKVFRSRARIFQFTRGNENVPAPRFSAPYLLVFSACDVYPIILLVTIITVGIDQV
ncbi:hypothetical protein HQ42_03505 [Porphyromonas gulae]|nr:hypothetical protein HQ42_03505 [Porphyromonas gulae]